VGPGQAVIPTGIKLQRLRHHRGYDAVMASAENEDLTARGRELGIDQWPYGVYSHTEQAQMLEWAESHHLRYVETDLTCPHWLIRSRSSGIAGRYSKRGSYVYDDIHHAECRSKYGLDHVTCWTLNLRPAVIVSQPYHLDENELRNLGALANEDLRVDVHGDGWYGHGTVCVEIWAADQR